MHSKRMDLDKELAAVEEINHQPTKRKNEQGWDYIVSGGSLFQVS